MILYSYDVTINFTCFCWNDANIRLSKRSLWIYQEGLIFHGKSCTMYMIFIQLLNVVCFVSPSERLVTENTQQVGKRKFIMVIFHQKASLQCNAIVKTQKWYQTFSQKNHRAPIPLLWFVHSDVPTLFEQNLNKAYKFVSLEKSKWELICNCKLGA